MNDPRTVVPAPAPANKGIRRLAGTPFDRRLKSIWVCIALAAFTAPAAALDGCKVLLCLAAPTWRAIPQCVPTVVQLFRDLARGRPFPTCDMSGPGNSSSHRWAVAPSYCPPQYTHVLDGGGREVYVCDYHGAVSVHIEGRLWTRTWWSRGGETVTEYTDAAKQGLGTWDTQFDDDYAAWLAQQPPPICDPCGE